MVNSPDLPVNNPGPSISPGGLNGLALMQAPRKKPATTIKIRVFQDIGSFAFLPRT